MSVFTDFQDAWAHRFPGCDLPQAWEDDVRANLERHKNKVAFLKEELEKEEFYVEYLERLLHDVEKAKRSSLSCNSETTRSDSSKQSDRGCNGSSLKKEPENILEHRHNGNVDSSSLDRVSGGKGNSSVCSECWNTCDHDQLSESSSVSQSRSSSYERQTKRKDNPYVTVIEVNGAQERKVQSLVHLEETAKSETSENDERGVGKIKDVVNSHKLKKVPPRPPPKRAKSDRPSSTINQSETTGSAVNVTAAASKNDSRDAAVAVLTNVSNFTTFKPRSSSKSSAGTNVTENVDLKLESSESANEVVKEPEIKSHCENLVNESLVKDEIVLNEEEETIYDTVPFEYENTDSTQESLITNTDKENCEELDPDGDYVVLSDKGSEHDANDPDSPHYSNYVNIDYFLRERVSKKDDDGETRLESITLDNCCLASDEEEEEEEEGGPSPTLVRSVSSDQELDINGVGSGNSNNGTISSGDSAGTGRCSEKQNGGKEDVFDVDSGVYSSSVESTTFIYNSSSSSPTQTGSKKSKNDADGTEHGDDNGHVPLAESKSKAEAERLTMYKCILNSIVESETIYVECLTVMLQYMKALKATLTTSQPVITAEDFNTVFFRIPDLHSLHHSFLEGLRDHLEHGDKKPSIGEQFKMLASRLNIYGTFLQNYAKAIDAVRRCNAGSSHFCEITKTIKLKTLKGQALALEELLHKPVARVQKNALVLHDLLKYTPEDQLDHKLLKSALKLTQSFLNELNMTANEGMFPPADRTQRHLVKNSFIVELSEGHRKLRHLFLFNDVIVCAKYKPSSRQKFTFEVKWYIPLTEITLPSNDHEGDHHNRECSSVDVLTLKARASTVREHIIREQRMNLNRDKPKSAGKSLDKHRKKLAELEAQLVLASPNLIFRIGHKSGKIFTFFVGSEFDRLQWTEALKVLNASALPNPPVLSVMELQAWITSCRQHLFGSFLFRSGLDEDLLLGTLQVSVHGISDIQRSGDYFVCFEVDSYGHFFRKARTKIVHGSDSIDLKQDFLIDLEGSQTLRIICYEHSSESGSSPMIRGKSALELSRNWLRERSTDKTIKLGEMNLSVSLKFIPNDFALKRFPSTRTIGLFGLKVQQVCKKEKSSVPFLIVSCINEVERRGLKEVGIYRVSGSASEVQRLKRAFETNVCEAEQLLKDLDVHTTTGLLKLYLRELPEALFTDLLYPNFFAAFSLQNQEQKSKTLLTLFASLPQVNQNVIVYLIDHMAKVNQDETTNKMSLHNIATVFGPTLLRPSSGSQGCNRSDMLAAGTIDVMAQAGILYFFLKRKAAGLQIVTTVGNNQDP